MDDPELIDLSVHPGDKLFGRSSKGWRTNAVLWSTTSRGVPYALGFKEAGDALLKQGLADHTQDLILFPALYCYRHALELVLKDLIYLRQRSVGGPYEVLRTHKLSVLWPKARQVMEEVWPNGDPAELDALGAVVMELAAVDLDGEQFRYDRDNAGLDRDLPEELMRVDLPHVYRMMQKLLGQLFGAVDGIDYMLSQMPDDGEY